MTSTRPHLFDPEPVTPGRLWRDRLIGGALLVLLVLARWMDLAPLTAMRLWASDGVLSLRPAAAQTSAVTVIDIDDQSLTALGQWPWPRDVLGRVVDRLVDAGASVVVLDMLLAEPDRMSSARRPSDLPATAADPIADPGADHDASLAEAMARRAVVTGAAVLATSLPASDREPIVGRMAIRGVPSLDLVPRSAGLVRPLPVLERASQGIGVINLYPDMDGIVRTVPGVLIAADNLLPGLAIEAARVASGASNLIVDAPASYGPEGIVVAGRFVPTDRRGRIWVDARDPQRVPTIAAHRLLSEASAPPDIRGRVAVVGSSAAGIGRLVKTPAGIGIPSAVYQALAVDSMLNGQATNRPAYMMTLEMASSAAIGLLLIVILPLLSLPAVAAVAGGVGVAVPAVAVLAAIGAGVLVDASFPLLVGLVLIGHQTLGRVHEQSVVRRRQSAMLARQDAYMRQVVDASFDAIVTVDRHGSILTANAGAERLFRIGADALLGTRIDHLLKGFWSGAVGRDPERALIDSVRGRQIIAAAADRVNGVEVPIELTVAETAAEEQVYVIVLRDISARIGAEATARQAIERLRDAIERITDGFALFGADRRLVICNTRFVEMLGEAGATARPGARFDVVMECYAESSRAPVDAAGRARDWVAERMAALSETPTPRALECQDGCWFRIDERPTADGGLVGVYTDITELKRREMEMTEAMLRAEAASSAKSEFLANMSHELRTPLNAVIGFADLMKQELFGPLGNDHYRAYVEDIIGSGSKLLSMIEVILDFSRSERATLLDSGARSALNEVVKVVVNDLRPAALGKDIAVTVALAPGIPPLNVDDSILYQILQNLLSNAIKFSSVGSPIRLETFQEADGRIGMSVIDVGAGIPADMIDKVTLPFWQRQGPLVRSHDGVGLGLAIVQSHTDALGGELRFVSRVGHGTTATVLLPASRVLKAS